MILGMTIDRTAKPSHLRSIGVKVAREFTRRLLVSPRRAERHVVTPVWETTRALKLTALPRRYHVGFTTRVNGTTHSSTVGPSAAEGCAVAGIVEAVTEGDRRATVECHII